MKYVRNAELIETIHSLNQRIAQLEQMIGQLSRPVIEHVNIERVYLQNPTLERLEFGLENLDIKELSGALNLGNNFGVNVERLKEQQEEVHKPQPNPKHKSNQHKKTMNETEPTKQEGQEGSSLERTSSGYKYKVNRTK